MAPDDSTIDVVERIQLGERSAEADLVHRFYGPVYSMVLARTGDPEVAKDLTQEIMLSVVCALRDGKLRNPDGLVGYICGTMRNRVKYHFRSLHLDRVGELPSEPVLDQLNPEEVFESVERQALANQVIERLSPIDQKILRLTLVEGLSPKEIGKRLRMKSEVVRQHKSRAIRKAREMLKSNLSRS